MQQHESHYGSGWSNHLPCLFKALTPVVSVVYKYGAEEFLSDCNIARLHQRNVSTYLDKILTFLGYPVHKFPTKSLFASFLVLSHMFATSCAPRNTTISSCVSFPVVNPLLFLCSGTSCCSPQCSFAECSLDFSLF